MCRQAHSVSLTALGLQASLLSRLLGRADLNGLSSLGLCSSEFSCPRLIGLVLCSHARRLSLSGLRLQASLLSRLLGRENLIGLSSLGLRSSEFSEPCLIGLMLRSHARRFRLTSLRLQMSLFNRLLGRADLFRLSGLGLGFRLSLGLSVSHLLNLPRTLSLDHGAGIGSLGRVRRIVCDRRIRNRARRCRVGHDAVGFHRLAALE